MIIKGPNLWQMILYDNSCRIRVSYINDYGAVFKTFHRLKDLIEFEKELLNMQN